MLSDYKPEVLLDCIYYLKYAADINRLRYSHYKCMLASANVLVDYLVNEPAGTVIPASGKPIIEPIIESGCPKYTKTLHMVYSETCVTEAFYRFNRQ